MQPISRERYPRQNVIHPLQRLAQECGALSVRLLGYVGMLGLIAIAGVWLMDALGRELADGHDRLSRSGAIYAAKQQVTKSPGIPVAGAPNVFLRGSL